MDQEFQTIIKNQQEAIQKSINDSPNYILMSEKLRQFQQATQDTIESVCINQTTELNKYGTAEIGTDGQIKLNKYAGKEQSFDKAWEEYLQCISPIMTKIFPLQSVSVASSQLMNLSLENCVVDCSKNQNKNEFAKCTQSCFDVNFLHNYKAYENIMLSQLDPIIKELQNTKKI